MRKSSFKLLAVSLILLAGLTTAGIGSANVGQGPKLENPYETDAPQPTHIVGRGDCGYLQNPDILGDPRKRIHELSQATEWLETRLAANPNATTTNIPRKNFIDEEIFRKMETDKVPSAALSSDEEFVRRVTLDLTGRIPSADLVVKFVADTSADKRDRYIDSLIGTPEFVDRWTMWVGDLVQNTARTANVNRYPTGRSAFHGFIKSSIQQNKPYDEFVREMITANGNTFVASTGATNHIVGAITPMGPPQDTYDTAAVQSTKRFLGIETLDCLLCHGGAGHLNALNLWGSQIKREQAWGMSAFFTRQMIRAQRENEQPLILSFNVSDLPRGDYLLNTTSGNRTPRQPIEGENVVQPQYLFTNEKPNVRESYRAAFARILTKDRQFARATVNYLWAHFFGLGIVDPPTNFDLARLDPAKPPAEPWALQPSHPALLEKLTDDFISSGYNLQTIMRRMVQSSAYQLSSRYDGEWKEDYTSYFARKLVRRLDAEEVYDAMARATGVAPSVNVYTNITGAFVTANYAMQLPDTVEQIGRAHV